MNIELLSYTIRTGPSMCPTGPGIPNGEVTHWQVGHNDVTRLVAIAPATVLVSYKDGRQGIICSEGMGGVNVAATQSVAGGKR